MPTKESKTAKELEAEISSLLGGFEVTVYNDAMSGWTATVFGPSDDVAAKYQQIVQVVSELHARCDLKEEAEALVAGPDLAPSETTALSAEPRGVAAGEKVENLEILASLGRATTSPRRSPLPSQTFSLP